MNRRDPNNPRDLSMQELFRLEAENQIGLLTSGLLGLEKLRGESSGEGREAIGDSPSPLASGLPQLLESLMRAAHSMKGAARIVNLSVVVQVSDALEDCFVAAQQGAIVLKQEHVDV